MTCTAHHVGFRLFGVIGLMAATLAAATIWVLLAHPVAVADAVEAGELSPLLNAVAAVLAAALRDLISYL